MASTPSRPLKDFPNFDINNPWEGIIECDKSSQVLVHIDHPVVAMVNVARIEKSAPPLKPNKIIMCKKIVDKLINFLKSAFPEEA